MAINNELIPLTDLQKSYCNGLNMPCGMVTKLYFLYLNKSKHFNIALFTESVRVLVKAHRMLRCKVINSEFQMIEDEAEPNIEFIHCEHLDVELNIEEIKVLAEKVFRRSLEKDEFPQFKFVIFQGAKVRTIVMLCCNGIIMDGWSYEILMRDLERIYSGNTINDESVFSEYVSFLANRAMTQEYWESKEYWVNQAKNLPGLPEIPLLCSPSNIKAADSYTIYRIIPQNVLDKVTLAAAESGVTMFALLLTMFAKTISLYSRNHSFLLNLPYAARPAEINGINDAIGLYSDYLLFAFEDEDCSIEDMAVRCQMRLMELQDYANISSSEILKIVQKANGENVQAPIVFTSTWGLAGAGGDIFEKILARPQTSQVWAETLLTQGNNNMLLSMTCIEGLIGRRIAEGMADLFCESVLEIAVNKKGLLAQKSLSPCKKDLSLINELNNTDIDEHFPCLSNLISKSFDHYANCLAIGCDDITLTYSELSEKVCSLLYLLRVKHGLVSGRDRIGIYLTKGYEQIIWAVTALCGNFAYMPIDPALPVSTLKDCMRKANLTLLITERCFIESLAAAKINHYIAIENITFPNSPQDTDFASALPEDISIIINTSGTTGTPKSICLYQRSLVNCLVHSKDIFKVTQSDRVLAVTNFSHDMAIFDSIGILLWGGAVIVPEASRQKEPGHWNELIAKYNVTIWNSVPAFMEMKIISETLERNTAGKLRLIILGGDWIRPSLAQKLIDTFPNADVFSVGGPTETTVWNIYHQIKMEDINQQIIPYGRPFPNTQYYILNDRLALCPVGVVGTMYVGGKSLAAEYAGMPLETNDKFITWQGERLYNTGDLGAYFPDGTIQIKGRDDDQVKINGKRIEPSGIEQVINSVNGVLNSVVLVNAHTHKLVAYYTAEKELSKSALFEYMRNTLPEYMIPSFITYVKEMPLSRNGKVDRQYLAEKSVIEPKNTALPADSLVLELLEFCKEILSDRNISSDMNFYMMGGDSISSLKFTSKIKQAFSVELSISEILEYPCLAQWATIIRTKQLQNKMRLFRAREIVNEICREVLGSEFRRTICLLDFDNITENSAIISDMLSAKTQKGISKYDVLCHPFAEDWIGWIV